MLQYLHNNITQFNPNRLFMKQSLQIPAHFDGKSFVPTIPLPSGHVKHAVISVELEFDTAKDEDHARRARCRQAIHAMQGEIPNPEKLTSTQWKKKAIMEMNDAAD